MRIAVLGPLEVDEGRILLAPRDQVVLEALAARPGETVRAEALGEALWGEDLPASWPKVVQGCVSRLRKALGTTAIVTSGTGYRLAMHRDDIDHLCFEDLMLRASELLATGEPERARYASGQALGLWRGDPLERLTEWESGRIEAERLGERRRDAEDLYAESAIHAGRHGDVLGELHRMVAQQPTRERRWGLLALAQYQAGRQAEALGTLQRARTTLVNEFGLDPGHQLAELEEAILRQDPTLVAGVALPAATADCPYLGLVAYDIGDAAAYFGREADATACLTRLDQAGVLAVVGPSGSGKSSLIRAGVAAALVRDGRSVQVVTPGSHPEDVLALAPKSPGAVFVVDQCEEALALAETSPEREAFFTGLVDFAQRGPLVISLRADRLGELAAHPEFARLVEKGLYLLGAMGTAELRSAIEGPAAQAGLRLEPGLVDLLVREAEGSASALPLLSHVLRQTWRRREADTLTVAGYAATGGVRAAVAQSAERLYRELTATQQGMLRDLMVRLVSSDDAGGPVRTRVSRRTVTSDAEHTAVVEALVGARLLSSDGDTVEIAHESLAVAWPRLRSWLDDDVDGLRIMRHLTVAAESWDQLDRPDSELYRGVRQARAAEWRRGHDPELTPPERAFLDASAELADKEQRATETQVRRERRLNQRLRLGLAGVAALLAVSIVAGALALTARNQADDEAARAERQSVVADARRLGAEALRAPDLDLALLLAAAGVHLDDSVDSQSNLTAVLDRAPQLVGLAKVTSPNMLSVRADGKAVAVGGNFTGVTVFDSTAHAEVARNHDIPVRSVRFNPNGTQLAVSVNPYMATGERRIDPVPLRILDPVTAALADTQPGGVPKGRVVHQTFAFSGNGRWLVAGFIHPIQADENTAFRVWNTRDLSHPVASFTGPYLSDYVAVSDDGTRVYVDAQDALVHSWDVGSGREVGRAAIAGQETFALSPDGTTLLVNRGQQVALLDPKRLTVTSVIDEDGGIGPIEFSPRGDLFGYTVDDALVVRRLKDPATEYARFAGAGGGDVGFSPDGRTAYSTAGDRLLAWDLVGDRRFLRSIDVQPPPDSAGIADARVSPDGQTVANLVTDGDESYAVQLLDVRTGQRKPLPPLRHTPGYYVDMAWRPDSRMVASVQSDQWVDLWDRDTGRLHARYRVPDRYGVLDRVGFSGDSTRLVLGTHLGWVHTVELASMELAAAPVLVKAKVPVAFTTVNRDGNRAIVWVGGLVNLVDIPGGSVQRSVHVGFSLGSMAWSPDGKTVVVAGQDLAGDGILRVSVLDPHTLATTRTFSGSQASGYDLIAFSVDGERFVTVGGGGVSLWQARPPELLGTVRSDAYAAGFDSDNAAILVASPQGAVSAWDPRRDEAVKVACRIVGRDLTEAEWRDHLPDRKRQRVC
ncbi:BTAD domain-containing putative transcriptional regulator [Pedococcus bigeumensis]|uniref:nSTAND1 domain-containing NTPase n=1 Tax=Pedococcus bigeumensis TaxID=433644 RepID=UPI0013872A0D|nr:BTAD domain-containing putative transcriptional regulator [Pedococcus bigeumensis]